MVFKNKLFFSSKTSESSSHDSSNSSISFGSNSPIRSDTKKSETASKDETLAPNPISAGGFVGSSGRSGPRKRFPSDIKSFSHELNSKGVHPFTLLKPCRSNNVEEILDLILAKFDKAKEEVNSDLAVFAADLVGVLEKNAESHPEWEETFEDLLILARSCAMTTPGDFWLHCEGIVKDLDDRRQELPPGVLKHLHTRMLFILTRCTRLLQFYKSWGEVEQVEE
ncbi:putative serine/threonine protein kinase IREH1 [Raphanus sativus]|uniref:Probable serine/threonine protein kinase IREH1 n=1 Tax=Raphanus sativus TaxID=3726 RepID=A0A6J0P059_RAPSA|nr:probable serine/threonine protein kinase IREH1 [Raphanus sativus]KAJ4893879.1 putative serine/threonine protein kinase IREH1 [Raphanus sativus]